MKTILLLPLLIVGLSLVACTPGATTSAKPPPTSAQPTQSNATDQVAPTSAAPTNGEANTAGDMTRVDEQNFVTVQVTPLNLTNPGETIDFDVSMNTHSVDLAMNLAQLATLTADSGQKVVAQKWDGSGAGHHVTGKLIFPAAVNGKPFLQGVSKLTLTLRDVAAPERVFTWELK